MKKISPYLAITSLCLSLFLLLLPKETSLKDETPVINSLLNDWHAAAARADYNAYFGKIAKDGHYMGTDATENWDKTAFSAFSKPYFDKGKAWDFKALQRHIFFSNDGNTAWFDELLDTKNMKICRGSGILEKEGREWKIKHYVLSVTVPNEVLDEILPAKAKYEDAVIARLKQ